MSLNRVLLSASVVAIFTGCVLVVADWDTDAEVFYLGLVLMTVGYLTGVASCMCLKNNSLDEAFEAGYDAGYRKGRRVGRPEVVPLNRRRDDPGHASLSKATVWPVAGDHSHTRRAPDEN